jgi:outer membrane receptor for ferrienterochelin and colicins
VNSRLFRLIGPAVLIASTAWLHPASAALGDFGGMPDSSSTDELAAMSLEELSEIQIIYSASRYEQTAADAPADVTIISHSEIERHGWQTLAEVLSVVRGYFVTYDRAYRYAGIRGFGRLGDYNSRILLLVDGHRLNDNIYDQAFLGEDLPIDLSLVE